MTELLPEEKRQEVFRALIELQDGGCSTEQSRSKVSSQFSISVSEIREVEREGIAKQWPPL
jgi:hypothetical protein